MPGPQYSGPTGPTRIRINKSGEGLPPEVEGLSVNQMLTADGQVDKNTVGNEYLRGNPRATAILNAMAQDQRNPDSEWAQDVLRGKAY